MLSVHDIHYSTGGKQILKGISTEFAPAQFHVIVGPNGSGKSTFLKVFSGELKPQQGKVLYDEEDAFRIDKSELARRRAVMSQQPELHFPLSVKEIVMFGRYPHFRFKPSKNDEEICQAAMRQMEIETMVNRDYLTLSGGEKQRVQFARVLAQIWEAGENNKKYLFLDEAISHLDLRHQHQLLNISKDLCGRQTTVIAILHDLNLAMQYADKMLFMKDGRLCYELVGNNQPETAVIREIFEVEVSVLSTDSGKRVLVF